ncbi:hypothetical protein J6590_097625 [Homalodisca vitripennis]|nr:hypothetical protein J6590_097625 [Homalodisca vitripennis]
MKRKNYVTQRIAPVKRQTAIRNTSTYSDCLPVYAVYLPLLLSTSAAMVLYDYDWEVARTHTCDLCVAPAPRRLASGRACDGHAHVWRVWSSSSSRQVSTRLGNRRQPSFPRSRHVRYSLRTIRHSPPPLPPGTLPPPNWPGQLLIAPSR